jgi:xanthine dehydrogenase accessory factor
MRDILVDVDRWLEQGESIALATVIQTWGSSPRPVGAKMAITPGGKISGSVSGGCVEAAVFQAGAEALKTGRPQLLHFGVADETAWEVGLACGGTIEVFVKPLDQVVFRALKEALEKPLPVADITVVKGPPELLGSQAVFGESGKLGGDLGPELRERVLQLAGRALAERRSQRHELNSLGGPVEVFVDVTPPPPTLVMVGGVHIAMALTAIAGTLGYQTVIIDPRRAFGNPERFARADQLIGEWPEEALSRIQLTRDTAVAMLTHDPKIDDPALSIALRSPAFYIGALGSRATQAKRHARLLEAGLTETQLARLHAPIGLDINAETPEEIALAIMAEVVAARHSQDQHTQQPTSLPDQARS